MAREQLYNNLVTDCCGDEVPLNDVGDGWMLAICGCDREHWVRKEDWERYRQTVEGLSEKEVEKLLTARARTKAKALFSQENGSPPESAR
jgi:NMD protein affecting ribosome stability and mRNA decay